MIENGKVLTLDDLRSIRGAAEAIKKWEKTEQEGTRGDCTCKAVYEKDVSPTR